MPAFTVTGQLVDINHQRIFPAEITIENKRISKIRELKKEETVTSQYIIPGFVDSHVHIESSMLVPAEFARLAVVHGTVATVSDPHEIANVCGLEGVDFMIENGKSVPFKFNFGAPSCVPATSFETAGAEINADDVISLLKRPEIRYLSEMMNFPGVLNADDGVIKKIAAAHHHLKPVDGHAPGLRGKEAEQYIAAGISTDHECLTREEALDKLRHGMKIIIREGSAAKNFDALIPILHDYPNQVMFCSDDKHPDSLVLGHINTLCARSVAEGINVFHVLKAACVNPVHHYSLDVGLLKEGDHADFACIKDLETFQVLSTYINGEKVAENGETIIQTTPSGIINNFNCSNKSATDFEIPETSGPVPIIEALDGQLITNRVELLPKIEDGKCISDPDRDILKIVVVNRYYESAPAKGFIKNFGLKEGALASSVAHDSHNIVAVGVDDESIAAAVNMVIAHKGAVSLVRHGMQLSIPLPIAGLMSNADGYHVAQQFALMDREAKAMGSKLSSPFMTLSFMALLVIPHIKLSDRGLFDGDSFQFI